MAANLLTDRACKAAKPKAAIYYKSDGAGLRLQVRSNPESGLEPGRRQPSKYWQFRYTLDGRESTYQIGSYPDVSLDEARAEAAKARKLVGLGIRPSVDRKVQRASNVERGEATFKAVADEWLARNQPDWSATHYERNKGMLTRILYPDLGTLPVTAITEPMLLRTLVKHYDMGIKSSALRARMVASQVFAYAKDTHRATQNPARDLAGSSVLKVPEVRHFAAISPEQVGPLLRAIDASQVEPVTRAALLMLLYTGMREGVVRAARWQEFDLDAKSWTVPAKESASDKGMKSGRAHTVPLPEQAVAMLTELAKLTRRKPSSFVFASNASKHGHLAENTLRLRLHGLGFKVTAHGFRSLLTDLLNTQGFNADAIERQLDHQQKDKVRAAYLRSDFYEMRRDMMQWVADWADAQRISAKSPPMPNNVLRLRRKA